MSHSTIAQVDEQVIDTTDHAEPFIPTAEDWAEVARWWAETEDAGHAEEPTPVEVLDYANGTLPWWASPPECPELDTPISLPPEPVTTRERFYVQINGDPAVLRHGYVLRDRQLHDAAIRRFCWFHEAKAFADELNSCEPRARTSWNPERDAIGL